MPYAFLSLSLLRWMSVGECLWTGAGDYGMGRLEEDPSSIEHSLKRLPPGFAPLDPCWFINSRTSSGPKTILDFMFASALFANLLHGTQRSLKYKKPIRGRMRPRRTFKSCRWFLWRIIIKLSRVSGMSNGQSVGEWPALPWIRPLRRNHQPLTLGDTASQKKVYGTCQILSCVWFAFSPDRSQTRWRRGGWPAKTGKSRFAKPP